MSSDALSPFEKRTAISLSLVFALRMLGLFMIMPVFAIYGQHLIGYSPLWVGFAIGAYGLTQALLQIPAGMLSDKFGRKPIIYGGLILFAIGSLVAAFSESVYGVTFGRALQGTGAIASAILALAADVTREQQRPKAMGMIGVSIGLAFAVAMVAGPVLAPFIGLHGLFLITAAGAILGIAIVHYLVPNVVNKAPRGETIPVPSLIASLAKQPQLLRLNLGIFILHLSLTAIFVTLPLLLQHMHLAANEHWKIYLPALLLSFLLIVPMLIISSKKQKNKHFYLFSILLMALSLIVMSVTKESIILMFVVMLLFFTAFNFLEASLPAFISMLAPAGTKGTAMGIYSTHQFLGAFFGGIVGGLSYKLIGSSGLFLCLAGLMIIWFLLSLGLQNPSKIRTFTFTTDIKDKHKTENVISQLVALQGALEVVIIAEEQTVYIKANTQTFQQQEAQHILSDS
ncbi:MFS transporter [Psychromonas sp. RZ22]|uniref:MFS transporter n=1 Tax=Psychromonas algarum TaxID=2555643 RepID=UPI001068C3B6|nr:MFS transporter [Psychromonas sp. RZ22]TEW55655.1 MFS transporter [Psychromonas sp. RZ22]